MYHIVATVAPAAPPSVGLLHSAAPPLPSEAKDHSSAPAPEPSISAGGRDDAEAAWGAAAVSASGSGPPSAGLGLGSGAGVGFGPDVLDAGAFYRGVRRTGLQYGPAFRVVLRARADGAAAVLRCAMQPPLTTLRDGACLTIGLTARACNCGHSFAWLLRAAVSGLRFASGALHVLHFSSICFEPSNKPCSVHLLHRRYQGYKVEVRGPKSTALRGTQLGHVGDTTSWSSL